MTEDSTKGLSNVIRIDDERIQDPRAAYRAFVKAGLGEYPSGEGRLP